MKIRDQEIFNVFKDMDEVKVESEEVSNIVFSLEPLTGSVEDWDMGVRMSKEDLGAHTDNMKLTGSATISTLPDSPTVTFSAPFTKAKVSYELEKQKVDQIGKMKIDFEQLLWNEKDVELEIDNSKMESSQPLTDEHKKIITDGVIEYLKYYRT